MLWFRFSPTLYIGQHRYGLYALPSYVESETTTISSNEKHLLLGGPSHIDVDEKKILLPGNHIFIPTDIADAQDDCQSVKNAIILGSMQLYNNVASYWQRCECYFIKVIVTITFVNLLLITRYYIISKNNLLLIKNNSLLISKNNLLLLSLITKVTICYFFVFFFNIHCY